MQNNKKFINNYSTNCHGLTFTNGQLIVYEDAVNVILNEEYELTEERKRGNIGIYRKGEERTIDHSVTIISPGFVYEKDGIGPLLPFSIGASPIRSEQELKYYRKK